MKTETFLDTQSIKSLTRLFCFELDIKDSEDDSPQRFCGNLIITSSWTNINTNLSLSSLVLCTMNMIDVASSSDNNIDSDWKNTTKTICKWNCRDSLPEHFVIYYAYTYLSIYVGSKTMYEHEIEIWMGIMSSWAPRIFEDDDGWNAVVMGVTVVTGVLYTAHIWPDSVPGGDQRPGQCQQIHHGLCLLPMFKQLLKAEFDRWATGKFYKIY